MSGSTGRPGSDPPASGRRLRLWRGVLGGFGTVVLAIGVVVLVVEVPAVRYPGVAAWLLGALVAHDVVVAGAVFAVGLLLRRARWRPVTTAIVGGAAVVGAIVALVAVPAAVKAAIGTANPTVLPLDYVGNLLMFELGVAIVATVAVVCVRAVSSHRSRRP